MSNMKVHEIITNTIIDKIEKGNLKSFEMWKREKPCNYLSKRPYSGINRLLLTYTDFKSPYYLTYNQSKQLGNVIKTNQLKKYQIITYLGNGKKENKNEDNEIENVNHYRFLRYYRVYNLEQTTIKLKEKKHKPKAKPEKLIKNYKHMPEIKYNLITASYTPTKDYIKMPYKKQFKTIDKYYSVLFHELIHSTGHPTRLNRFKKNEPLSRFGSSSYSKEELTAELGSAFLCQDTGIKNTLDKSASYMQSWLKVLKNDSKFIISASSKAEKASEFIHNNI